MSPVFPVALTQLETKALFVHGFALAEVSVPGMDGTLTDAFLSGLRKLQEASHIHFTPGAADAH